MSDTEAARFAEFMGARYDEAEALARGEQRGFIDRANGAAVRQGDWARVTCDPVTGPFGGQTRQRNIGTGLYVAALSDPDRVLRDIALKRAILAEHSEYCDQCRCCWRTYPCHTARQLGAEFSDHPDYRAAEWEP